MKKKKKKNTHTHKEPEGDKTFKQIIKSDMRAKKSKFMKIYQKIRQTTHKKLLDQLKNDKKPAGTEKQKETSNHQKKEEKIHYLNYTLNYVKYLMKTINHEWNKKYTLYKNRNHWDEQILKLHQLKIQRMIVLEMVQYLQQTKDAFFTELHSSNKH